MKSIFTLLFVLYATPALSQDTLGVAPADTQWTHKLSAALTATQVALSDWQQGGESLLSYAATADGRSDYAVPALRWENRYKLAFGQTKLGRRSTRKTDDRIELESVFLYTLGAFVDPYAAATLRTQFTKGYTYDPSTDQATPVSDFFDPAYLTQSVGGGVTIVPELKSRLGFALREIITGSFTHYSDDPSTTEIERIRIDGGFESVTNLDWSLEQNLLLAWQLELFVPLSGFSDFTLRSNTALTAKVTEYVTTNLTVQIINDRTATPRTQVKETLAIGLSYAVF